MTTTSVSPRIRITGPEAAGISRHVTTLVRPGRNWSEVQVMSECGHGCKLHARRWGAGVRYRLIHSATYGCPLGRSAETREVPVSVLPRTKS